MYREFLLVVLIVAASGGAVKRSTDPQKYAVLIDAGSTGSKLKVYRWTPAEDRGTLPDVHPTESKKFKPGLSWFAMYEKNVRVYLESIINKAKSFVPVEHQNTTEIYVMATAGLRLLSTLQSKGVMDAVRSLLSDPSFSPFMYTQGDVQVISGEEEGVYAWIAANYLTGFFNGGVQSTGILEMGGASTQVAFIPEGPLYSDEFQVVIKGQLYQVYVQSYLDFGMDGIQREVVHKLLEKNSSTQGILKNPCMLSGDSRMMPMEDGSFVDFVGDSQPEECLKLLQEIVRPKVGYECQPKPCAIGSVYQPPVGNNKFFATQAFRYTVNDLGGTAVRSDGTLDINVLEDVAVNNYCPKSLQTIVDEGGNPDFASSNCATALYITALLHEAFGFPKDTHSITLKSKVNGESIDWAFGAILLEIARSQCQEGNTNKVSRRK